MNNDTRETAAAETAAGGKAANEDERGGTRELLARAVQERLRAAARQSVAIGLCRAGSENFTRVSVMDLPDGFPMGSEYGALCPQDDLSEAQARSIFQEAKQAVREEAGRLKYGASSELAPVITRQLAEWEQGAPREWKNMREVRQALDDAEAQMKTDKATVEKTPETETRATPGMTPGWQYINTYLLDIVDSNADAGWIAESIDDGTLIVCPRCHFLHLPHLPFPLSFRTEDQAPVDACDVCAALLPMCDPINWGQDWEKALASANHDLTDERSVQAITLYQLWIGATNGADALRVASIAEALDNLRRMSRTADGENLPVERRDGPQEWPEGDGPQDD